MSCLCCTFKRKLFENPFSRWKSEDKSRSSSKRSSSARRLSVQQSLYQIEAVSDRDDPRDRNAMQIRMQLMLVEELNKDTYGLEVQSKSGQYVANDFFAFKEILGSGSTAVVFRAIFKPTGETLAVKFIPHFKDNKYTLLRELQALRLLCQGSRFLIEFHSNFRVGNNLYFVMHICEGGNLNELLMAKSTKLPAKLMKIYLKEIVCALLYLHSRKLVHRDVSLKNLFIDSHAHLRLGDFGLCRMVDDPQGEMMTDCGQACIKAPEMYLDKPCSLAIDWWSVGILVYRFITGNFPFKTDKLTVAYQSVTKHQEKYPEWAFSDASAKHLCQSFLKKKPQERLGWENEETAIKSHPYFVDVNWNIYEDVIGLATTTLEKNGVDSSSEDILYAKLLKAVGVEPPDTNPFHIIPEAYKLTYRPEFEVKSLSNLLSLYIPGWDRQSLARRVSASVDANM